MDTCALCLKAKNLQQSHIIPKFISKWLRETSPTGFSRGYPNSSNRLQDGLKIELLCQDCEQRFSVLERLFSIKVFHPSLNDEESDYKYEPWMHKFVVSLSWRALAFWDHTEDINKWPKEIHELRETKYEEWRKYLLDDSVDHDVSMEHHLIFLDTLLEADEDDSPFFNRYMQRVIDLSLIDDGIETHVFIKFPYFTVLGCLRSSDKEPQFSGSLVVGYETLLTREYYMPDNFLNFLNERANSVFHGFDQLPEKQWQKMISALDKNEGNPKREISRKAYEDDVELFGDKAINPIHKKKLDE